MSRHAAPESGGASEDRRVGIEFRKFYRQRLASGFIDRFLSGRKVLDIGFAGGDPHAVPITDDAIGVGLDYPGYDGTRLPFADESQHSILASHVLEHLGDYRENLAEWYRVLKVGGFLVLYVPHRDLYERRPELPSRWNGDHKRFYTPASLLAELEESLPVNGFRVRHLADNDRDFRYDRAPHEVPVGGYEIELVIEKIARPSYSDNLRHPAGVRQVREALDSFIYRTVAHNIANGGDLAVPTSGCITHLKYITPWAEVCRRFVWEGAPELGGTRIAEPVLRPAIAGLLELVEVDAEYYFQAYPELRLAAEAGRVASAVSHWRAHGYFEGRLHQSALL